MEGDMRFVLIAAVLLASPIAAHAEACKTTGAKDAQEIALNLDDTHTRRGLDISIQLGLLPPEFPLADIEANKAPCTRGTFAIFKHKFELFGEDDGPPPRWATAETAKGLMTLYLAMMPKPDPALAWFDKTRPVGPVDVQFKDDEYMWALAAVISKDRRFIFAFFDKIPDDATLKERMQKAGEGRARWLVAYDVADRRMVVNTPR